MKSNENLIFLGIIILVSVVALFVLISGRQIFSEDNAVTTNAAMPLCPQYCQTNQGTCDIKSDLTAKYARCTGSIAPKDKTKGAILCGCPATSFSTTKGITPRRIKQVTSIL